MSAKAGDVVLVALARLIQIDSTIDDSPDRHCAGEGPLQLDDPLLGRLGFGDQLYCLGHSLMQLRCIAGVEEFPARVVCNTLQLGLLVFCQIEADHMHGQVDTGCLQFLGNSARVGLAGFLSVTDQDDGGPLLGILQRPALPGVRPHSAVSCPLAAAR